MIICEFDRQTVCSKICHMLMSHPRSICCVPNKSFFFKSQNNEEKDFCPIFWHLHFLVQIARTDWKVYNTGVDLPSLMTTDHLTFDEERFFCETQLSSFLLMRRDFSSKLELTKVWSTIFI